jgi:hypothetical protein
MDQDALRVGGLIFVGLFAVVVFVILATLSRWIFRINEILTCLVTLVKRMDHMIVLLEARDRK